jgi:hypothetical protein
MGNEGEACGSLAMLGNSVHVGIVLDMLNERWRIKERLALLGNSI